jgi:type I restriction enzyme S subunit
MSKYRRYERYKDSGVEWIGEIPEHWEVSKLKYLTYCLDGKRIPLSSEQRGEMQGDIPYWGANCIIDYVNDWLIDGEVVLLGEDGAPFFDKYKDVAFYSNEKIWPNNHVHVLRALQSINAKLLTYILNTVDYSNYIKGSTRDKLTQSEMKNIFIQLPPVKEQKAIANFLDQKTAEIDALIADKEKLIQLLQEKRQAIITEAVTKGLNPNVRLKDSGIEWIGEIPEHWGIKSV